MWTYELRTVQKSNSLSGARRLTQSTIAGNRVHRMNFISEQVQIWAVKAAEEGIASGVIVRLWNVSTKPSRYELSIDGKYQSCHIVSHVETDDADETRELVMTDGKVSETLASSI